LISAGSTEKRENEYMAKTWIRFFGWTNIDRDQCLKRKRTGGFMLCRDVVTRS